MRALQDLRNLLKTISQEVEVLPAVGNERLRGDKRWKFGVPLIRNANLALLRHIVNPRYQYLIVGREG